MLQFKQNKYFVGFEHTHNYFLPVACVVVGLALIVDPFPKLIGIIVVGGGSIVDGTNWATWAVGNPAENMFEKTVVGASVDGIDVEGKVDGGKVEGGGIVDGTNWATWAVGSPAENMFEKTVVGGRLDGKLDGDRLGGRLVGGIEDPEVKSPLGWAMKFAPEGKEEEATAACVVCVEQSVPLYERWSIAANPPEYWLSE